MPDEEPPGEKAADEKRESQNQPEKTPEAAAPVETGGVAAAIADLQHDLHLVRNQVDMLQIAANEKKGPWWKEKALIISVIGLVFSAAVSIYTAVDQYRERGADDKKRALASLDSDLKDVVEMRTEDAKQQATLGTTNIAAYRSWATAINQKRALLLGEAVDIADKLPTEVSPVACLTIGAELTTDGRYEDANRFLDRGIAKANATKQSKAYLLSAKALVYTLPNSSLYDQKKGRALYNQAIDSFAIQADYTTLNNELTLIVFWANNEIGFGDPNAAAALLARAETVVNKCSLPEAGKSPLRRLVDDARTQINARNSPANLYDTSKWMGDWIVFEGAQRSGELSFSPIPGSTLTGFSKALFAGGALTARQLGSVSILNANKIRLDWNGSYAMGPNGPFQTVGYSLIELNPNGSLRGHDYQAGVPAKDWTARRASNTK